MEEIVIFEKRKNEETGKLEWVERYLARDDLAQAVVDQSDLDFWVVYGNKAIYYDRNSMAILKEGKSLLNKIKKHAVERKTR